MKDLIYGNLSERFPDADCELFFRSAYELLVAVILSAQCTDKRVNSVTPGLFLKYPTVYDLAKAEPFELESIIKPCGFYHNKAKSLIGASSKIVSDYGGEVPAEIDDLLNLPGVGRKTANVVNSIGFGGDAIAVDTHVFRVSNRLGIVCAKTPEECERQLEKFFDKDRWSSMHKLFVLFGRYVCKAKKPLCEECDFCGFCKYYREKKNVSGQSKNKN